MERSGRIRAIVKPKTIDSGSILCYSVQCSTDVDVCMKACVLPTFTCYYGVRLLLLLTA